MIVGIDDEQEISMMVEHQANWSVEDTIGIVCLLGVNRELDSSISIKKRSIVCHQSSSNFPQRRKERWVLKLQTANQEMKMHTMHARETETQRSNGAIDEGAKEQHLTHTVSLFLTMILES